MHTVDTVETEEMEVHTVETEEMEVHTVETEEMEVHTVDTVDTEETEEMVHTVDTVDTVDTEETEEMVHTEPTFQFQSTPVKKTKMISELVGAVQPKTRNAKAKKGTRRGRKK